MESPSELTSLKLIQTEPPVFESLGRKLISYFIPKNRNKEQYIQSKLFMIGTKVELTSGKYPIDEIREYLPQKIYEIGGKKVRIIAVNSKGMDTRCTAPGECIIEVKEYQSNGGSRRRARRSTRRRSTRRRSTHRCS